MRIVTFGAALALWMMGASAWADVAKKPQDMVLSSWMVAPESRDQMDRIAERFEVVHRHGDAFEVNVPINRRNEFLQLAPQAELLREDIAQELRVLEAHNPEWLAGYRSFEDVEAYLRGVAEAYPEIASLSTYGTSQQGRPLYVLKVSDNVEQDESEPELMITAATHGDELITVEVLLRLLDELLEGYGEDERLSALVDDRELFIIPVVNPDGFSRRSRYANGVDPNRDYPWPEREQRTSVACVDQIIKFFQKRDIAGSIDFHASGKMVMYPWAYTRGAVDGGDEIVLRSLGDRMTEYNRYRNGQISRVIYVAKGSSADYYYWQKGTLAYGIELATSKVPPSSSIPSVVTEAREMTWRFIEHF